MSPSLPPPRDLGAPVRLLVPELAARLGEAAAVSRCVALLGGAAREDHRDVLRYLTGHADHDPAAWPDHWLRTWGARGLLYAWDESAAAAVVGDTEHLDAVLARLHDDDEAVRRAAGRALDRLEARLDVEVHR